MNFTVNDMLQSRGIIIICNGKVTSCQGRENPLLPELFISMEFKNIDVLLKLFLQANYIIKITIAKFAKLTNQ